MILASLTYLDHDLSDMFRSEISYIDIYIGQIMVQISVSQQPVRRPASVRVYFSAGTPNKFQHYSTNQNCAFYYDPLGHARSILFSSANRQVHVVCVADSLSFAFLVKTNVAGEMNLAHNLSFTMSCCSSRLSRNRKVVLLR